jgi:hypothetical protein
MEPLERRDREEEWGLLFEGPAPTSQAREVRGEDIPTSMSVDVDKGWRGISSVASEEGRSNREDDEASVSGERGEICTDAQLAIPKRSIIYGCDLNII